MTKHKVDRCGLWPSCVCGDKWRFFQDAPLEAYEGPGAEPILEATLACVSAHCPDRRFRAHATVQLMKIQSSTNYSERRSIP
jgi:hypothetical protein